MRKGVKRISLRLELNFLGKRDLACVVLKIKNGGIGATIDGMTVMADAGTTETTDVDAETTEMTEMTDVDAERIETIVTTETIVATDVDAVVIDVVIDVVTDVAIDAAIDAADNALGM